MTTSVGPALSRSQRLDRLPFTRRHRRLVVGSGAGWALDAMDVGLISFVMAALAVQWGLDATTLSWIALDRLRRDGGRRQPRRAARGPDRPPPGLRRSPCSSTASPPGAAALSWSVASLLVFRFVVGLGLGAELPVASTLVSEFAPARIRGRVVVALESFWAVGWVLAALIGYFVVPPPTTGWRWALALGRRTRRLRRRRPVRPARVGALPRAARPRRRGGGRRPPVRGVRRASPRRPSP